MNKGYTTSTPKPESSAFKAVLQEKFFDNEMTINSQKQFVFSNSSHSKKLNSIFLKKTFESPVEREKKNLDNKRDQLRQQAIEAMQLAERRRLRICEENDLAFGIKRLNLGAIRKTSNDVECANKENWLAEKKRIKIKRAKEQKINEFLVEQEERKRNEEKRKRNEEKEMVAKLIPSQIIVNNPSYKISKTRFTYKGHMKLNASAIARELPKVSEEVVESKDEESEQLNSVADLQPDSVLRYNKDQIRSLNPYGICYM